MNGWRVTQLTFGSAEGRAHAHSYYDIPVIDAGGTRILGHRLSFTGRPPTPEDMVEVGLAHADQPGRWTRLGESRAWSWQQGPMAQWVAGGPRAVWNDRDTEGFVARVVDVETGAVQTLPRPVYAVSPDGSTALSLNMARLDQLRPGYGYASTPGKLPRRPRRDGVWLMPLDGGEPRLILSLRRAVAWLHRQLTLRQRLSHLRHRYHYWFNHAKISPNGRRFTVKLRWRQRGGPWSDRQGVSLTASMDGQDLRLLADATSHVIWQTDEALYLWQRKEMVLYRDDSSRGTRLGRLGEGAITDNVHLRHLPPQPSDSPPAYVFDTPYRETIDVHLLDGTSGEVTPMAQFTGHDPARGPFRCDLHPCPSSDGRRVVVTSLQDGARQIYLIEYGPA